MAIAGTSPIGYQPRAGLGGVADDELAGAAAAEGMVLPGMDLSRSDALPGERAVARTPDGVADHTAVLPPTHTVRPGETLSRVAERYRVTSRSMARVNAVDLQGTLRPGQELVIPDDDLLDLTTPEEVIAAGLAVEGLLADAAADFGLDPALVKAVAWVESRWEQRVVSHRGAIGIMQVQPATGAAMSHALSREINLHKASDNVVAGTAYLARRLDLRDGDVPAALTDYHQGPQSVAQRGRLPVTERYVAEVLRLRDGFAAHPSERPPVAKR